MPKPRVITMRHPVEPLKPRNQTKEAQRRVRQAAKKEASSPQRRIE